MIGLAGFLMWLVWIATYALALLRGERPRPLPPTARPVGALPERDSPRRRG